MKQQDLRVKKTLQNIQRGFISLLQKKPLNKITVTELALTAEINKGTFYLHYHDIYELYEKTVYDFFDTTLGNMDCFIHFLNNPEQFLIKFSENLDETFPKFSPFIQKEHEFPFQSHFISLLKKKLYTATILSPTPINDIKLNISLISIIYMLPQYKFEGNYEIILVLSNMIKNMFDSNNLIPIDKVTGTFV